MVHREPHGRQDRGPQPQLSGAMQDTYPLIAPGQLVGQSAGVVRRIVVNNQYVGPRQHRLDLVDQRNQIVAFVVGRQGNQDAVGGVCHERFLVACKRGGSATILSSGAGFVDDAS
jgi:hypothetical protein